MLTPEEWDLIGKQASNIYNDLELEIIQEISERIANVGYANTVVLNDILIAQEMGMLYEDIISLVSKYNEDSVSQVQEIFEIAGAKSLKYDDKIYKLAGLNPIPLKQSIGMLQLLASTARKTNNNLNNLTMTTAVSAQTQFVNAMNKAYMEVSTGVKSYSQSIIDTIKDISNQGAYIIYPSGQHRSIEAAVRMNIVTGVNQTCGKLQEMRADEMGWDLMELTAHGGARPDHAEWQGKIVSRSGKNKKYLSLDDIGYGEVTGFKGVNCKHDWMPFYEGSSRTYSNKELQELKNEKVIYNGKQISKYEATQIQRKMERQIRQDKKDIAGLKGILTSNNSDNKLIEKAKQQLKITEIQKNNNIQELNTFLKETGLSGDNSRLFIKNSTNPIKDDIIRLPNYDKVLIPKEKFTEYALNYNKDKNKAYAFEHALGYTTSNVDELIENIKNNVGNYNATPKADNGYGQRYEVIIKMLGANKKIANVKTAWIIDKDTKQTRLTSAYVTSKEWKKNNGNKNV